MFIKFKFVKLFIKKCTFIFFDTARVIYVSDLLRKIFFYCFYNKLLKKKFFFYTYLLTTKVLSSLSSATSQKLAWIFNESMNIEVIEHKSKLKIRKVVFLLTVEAAQFQFDLKPVGTAYRI